MRRNGILALGVVLLVTACQTSPAPTRSSSPQSGLAAADGRFFSGDYDGAETAYQALIDTGTAGARLHYSLFLDYTNRFQEALTIARTDQATDSASLGRLTRAFDWSAEVPGALEAGARAIAANPVDPTARAFYAEALADAGQFDPARRQLEMAQRGARDPFAVAEVERDWANYFRSKGDQLEEENHLRLSLRAQPSFPERQLELARFHFANSRAEKGNAIIARLEKAHPHDYRLLVSLADSLFLKGDGPGAIRIYGLALQVRPAAPEATLGLAEVEVAVEREHQAAHDALLASLRANPGSAAVYEFLRELDSLVLNIDPAAELGPIVSGQADSLAGPRKSALDSVSSYRRAAGLGPVAADAALAEAALAHAYYWLFNFGQSTEQGVGVHSESKSLPAFTGRNALERATHFGYRGERGAEDIAHTYSATSAVQRWVDTVYHRLPILDGEATSAGYAEAQVGAIAIQVLELGLATPARGDAVVYPAADQAAVPGTFIGGEVPDPLPSSAVYPVGYPITISVGSAYTLRVTVASLADPSGRDLAFYAIQPGPGGELGANQFAIVPERPLKPGRYTVQVTGFASTQRLQAAWQFTVSGP